MGVIGTKMLAIMGPQKPKEDNLLDTELGCHRTPKILWVVLVLMPQETHSGGTTLVVWWSGGHGSAFWCRGQGSDPWLEN